MIVGLAAMLVVSIALAHPALAQDVLKQTQQLEQSGDLKGAVTQYTAALQKARPGSAQDKQLREKIIDLALKLKPPPAIPEEAIKHGVRGEALAKAAHSDADRAQAAAEYRMALKLAPWWADAYLDYGLLEQAAHQPREAIWAYNLYLRAAPNTPNAETVRRKIYAQQALSEKTAHAPATTTQASDAGSSNAKTDSRETPHSFVGRWRSPSGSLVNITLKGNKVTAVVVQTSAAAAANGYVDGMTVFVGTISGVGKRLASGTTHASLNEWGCILKFDKPATLELSPDGRRVAVVESELQYSWNTRTCYVSSVTPTRNRKSEFLTRE